MTETTSNSRSSGEPNGENLQFSWKIILSCVFIAILASSQFTKILSLGDASLQSTDIGAKTGEPRSLSSVHVVTRPRPEVVGSNKDEVANSSIQLLQVASKAWTIMPEDAEDVETNKPIGPESRKVLHHSFGDVDEDNRLAVVPYENGLINGIIRAFQQDLHLVLRPDDIWLAITVQLSFYINAHAEELRSFFVRHEGRKELIVDLSPQTMETLDIAFAATLFAKLIQENVVDPDLERWILPNFSTTTSNDISVAAMVMMATTKAYFEYTLLAGCGFPSVTLLGERDDWVNLHERVSKLATFGEEPAEWSKILSKVIEKMIETYDRPDDQITKDFWMKAVHQAGWEASGRGIDSLSGWITAFCFWDDKGTRIHQYTDELLQVLLPDELNDKLEDRQRLVIDDVSFPIIRAKEVPQAVVEVPVKVIDMSTRLRYDTTIIAGSVGMTATASEIKGEYDTFQPRSGWWMLLDKLTRVSQAEIEQVFDKTSEL
ncbi:hypothetical protein TARUN_7036 [Trichoderma arundinaceum]|uniref:Uncharacterized protein n=1 Tax=Trichoderma arundinaceum TaxID=490622 RepID=A0A395NGF7_TRIAR|nr:hypothetical protein TARUN_7036 [Trichoderma arundinaceum]